MPKKFKWIDPSEKEIEEAVLQFLNYQVGVMAFKVNTMGVYDQLKGFYRKPGKFVLSGTPDVLACVSVKGVPVFVGLEIKSPSGRQSTDQKFFQERLQDRADGFYFIIRSMKEAEDAIKLVKQKVQEKLNITS